MCLSWILSRALCLGLTSLSRIIFTRLTAVNWRGISSVSRVTTQGTHEATGTFWTETHQAMAAGLSPGTPEPAVWRRRFLTQTLHTHLCLPILGRTLTQHWAHEASPGREADRQRKSSQRSVTRQDQSRGLPRSASSLTTLK